MVDAAVVMIENAHKHIERWKHEHPGLALKGDDQWRVIGDAAAEVGPALFFSLLIITLSFIPVFTLEAQEGRLFSPLAFTKTYAMAASAGLAVTLIPVLMGYLIRGRIPDERTNPLNRLLIAIYRPLLEVVLRFPKLTLLAALLVAIITIWPASRLGGEFMPPLDEGDLLYMPSALPGLSAGKVSELLQQTDRLIKMVPEVESVFGKAGRAETATDPAPLEMFETTIQFKPRDRVAGGHDARQAGGGAGSASSRCPGSPTSGCRRSATVSTCWQPASRVRSGSRSPARASQEIDRITGAIERAVKQVPGVSSALAERLTGGRYVDIDIDRDAAARFGLNIADVQSVVSSAIGGENIGETIEGLQRFPINVRYPREIRDSVEELRNLPVLTERGAQIRLADVASVRISDGPPMLKSENARLSGWVYVDIRGRDLKSVVQEMQQVVAKDVKVPPGYSVSWSGQFEFLERATARLKIVVPVTLLIIFVLLYLTFSRFDEALLIMATLPFALAGGIWLLWLLGYNLSVAGGVGFIALAGVAAEFGVIMLLYLKHAWELRVAAGKTSEADLLDAIREGAVLRVRPKAMTVAVIIAGLVPIMFGSGTGSEVMQRIAAPMVGGMVTAPLLSMFVIPAAYLLLRRGEVSEAPGAGGGQAPDYRCTGVRKLAQLRMQTRIALSILSGRG